MESYEVRFCMSNKCSLLCLTILFLIMTITKVKSDLPVHCKREQIEGPWTFRIEKVSFDAELNKIQTSCGHGFPDKVEKTVGDIDFHYSKYEDFSLFLSSDYKIYSSSEKSQQVGHWTPIYDEAFIVYYKDSVFTAFMKYYKSETLGNYVSNCDKTMIGWYILDSKENSKNWSCFFGFKDKVKADFLTIKKLTSFLKIQDEPTKLIDKNKSNFMELQVVSSAYAYSRMQEQTVLKNTLYAQEEIVEELNSLNLPWKADVHEEFRGLSFFELKEKLGLKRSLFKLDDFKFYEQNTDDIKLVPIKDSNKISSINKNEEEKIDNLLNNIESNILLNNEQQEVKTNSNIDKDSREVHDFQTISKYIDKELDEIDINQLPKNWDWRDVGGVNFVPEPRRQQNCGSCYVFSLVSSLESRLRILTNNEDRTEFSRQFPLACSFYTEGCQGGYPILVAKFFNEFEVIPETCAPYNPNNLDCKNICDYTKNPKKYFVSKYEYLGGFYGATNEINMLKEIRARGPIPGNMSVPWTFSYYKNGIFTHAHLKKNSGKMNKTTLFDQHISWSSVDHSILLVGYGEENGIKYWIGMNTWGKKWGENGFFRLLRGENDCNMETMGDAARIAFKAR
jgi:C1A family cysteine protease